MTDIRCGYGFQLSQGRETQPDIYILIVVALDVTIISSCLHFSMQNIEASSGPVNKCWRSSIVSGLSVCLSVTNKLVVKRLAIMWL